MNDIFDILDSLDVPIDDSIADSIADSIDDGIDDYIDIDKWILQV